VLSPRTSKATPSLNFPGRPNPIDPASTPLASPLQKRSTDLPDPRIGKHVDQ
jgi:hypothetical protein